MTGPRCFRARESPLPRRCSFAPLALFGLVLWQLRVPAGHGLFVPAEELGMTVTPGDVALERGSSLVVAARFKGLLPPRVELVYGQPGSTNSAGRS